jgi:hypothetical protein
MKHANQSDIEAATMVQMKVQSSSQEVSAFQRILENLSKALQ